MSLAAPAVLWLVCALAPGSSPEMASGSADLPAWCPGDSYEPQEGDLIFFTYRKILWHLLFRIGHTGPPFHVGIVVRMPDGGLQLLEAGSLSPDNVHVVQIKTRLVQYEGDVWVRRLHHPLTAEQAQQLTEFANCQIGRRFAKVRVGLEGASGRTLSVIRYRVLGPPPTDRRSWYCSELVIAAGIRIGLLPCTFSGPRMLFPQDLFRDCPRSLAPVWQSPVQLIFPSTRER